MFQFLNSIKTEKEIILEEVFDVLNVVLFQEIDSHSENESKFIINEKNQKIIIEKIINYLNKEKNDYLMSSSKKSKNSKTSKSKNKTSKSKIKEGGLSSKKLNKNLIDSLFRFYVKDYKNSNFNYNIDKIQEEDSFSEFN